MNEKELPTAFTVARGRALGLSKRSLLSDEYFRPHRGARTVHLPVSLRERCEALLPLLRTDQFLSHTTAGALWGLPFWLPTDDTIHVSAPYPTRAMRRPGVTGHQSKDTRLQVIPVRGLPLSDPLSTWCALASMVPLDELIVLADAMVRVDAFGNERPRYTREQLGQRPSLYLGPRFKLLGRAVTESRVGSESPMETRLRLVLTRSGIPQPRLNQDVFTADGDFLARPDQAWPAYRTIAEYDGVWHDSTAEQIAHDERRIERIRDEGWSHVKVVKEDLLDRPSVTVARVATALIAGGWDPPDDFPY